MSKKSGKPQDRGKSIVTPLEKLQRKKKLIASPIAKLGNVNFSSWTNEVLADVLWSVLVAGSFTQEKSLAIFRSVLAAYQAHRADLGKTMLSHSQLARLDERLFDALFSAVVADIEVNKALSPLLLFEKLPDRRHWERLISSKPDWNENVEQLASAVASCFNHQSQSATDCRWLRVMTQIAQNNVVFDSSLAERYYEIVEYPHRGDMRSVRPSIRAMEMSSRAAFRSESENASHWCEEFWAECWDRTHCFPYDPDNEAVATNYKELIEQIYDVNRSLVSHFLETNETTAIDPRHDGSFGLVSYAVHLLFYAVAGGFGQTVASRSILRTVLEVYITLSFLCTKDDETIWMQYRNFGHGQTKLAFLKNINAEAIPSFISLETLEDLANEDMWMEFQEIKLGAWSDKNLRAMAEEAGVKDVYDHYYDALSGYVHANWMAVRHSVFIQCLNPLHRFHRIPAAPRLFDQDAVPDIVKLANLCLEKLTALYPPFKVRFHLHKHKVPKKGVNLGLSTS